MTILYIVLISLFNTLYKYISVKNSMSAYNADSNFYNTFKTVSNIDISYTKIFIISLICTLSLTLIMILILKVKNKTDIKKTLQTFSPITILITLSLAGPILFINELTSFIILSVGCLIYLILEFKKVDRFSFVIILLFMIITFTVLYFITY